MFFLFFWGGGGVRSTFYGGTCFILKRLKKCGLCMAEKTFILYGNKSKMLNKRSEIMGICRHRRAHKLSKLL